MPDEVLEVGDLVEKIAGDYRFKGRVVAVFHKLNDDVRVVVENADGVLHIFHPRQLGKVPT